MSQSTQIFWVSSQVGRLESTHYYRGSRLKSDDSIVNWDSRIAHPKLDAQIYPKVMFVVYEREVEEGDIKTSNVRHLSQSLSPPHPTLHFAKR